MIEHARAWKLGDDIDTDVIIPARYVALATIAEMASHTLEPVRPDFAPGMKPGDVIVAGENFGSGSSREHAVLVLKELGVGCVVARSFARIFYRNGINNGLLLVQAADVEVPDGDHVTVDLDNGFVLHEESGRRFESAVMSDMVQAIIRAGGLIPYVEEHGVS